MRNLPHMAVRLVASLTALLMPVAPALAQQQRGEAPGVNPWPAIIVACLLVGVILSASFKSAKRSHQD